MPESDKFDLCKLIANLSDPVIVDFGRLFLILMGCIFKIIIVIANRNAHLYPQTFKFKFQSKPLILDRCEFVGLAENIYNRSSALARQSEKVILLGAAIALPTTAILFFSSFFRAHLLEFKSK